MKVLHITSVTNPQGNGVAVAVLNYYRYEKELTDVAVYNVEADVVGDSNSYNISNYKTISDLPDGFDRPDLVVFNELYKPIYLRLYKECLKNKIPYLIIPHGCLTRESQKKSSLKKMVANKLLFNKFIKNSVAIQYLNINEHRESVVKNHVFIISGNGIDIQKKKNKRANRDFVYIGRYGIRQKGLDLLARVVYENKKWFKDNHLKIKLYGRNSGNNGYDEMKKLVDDYSVSDIMSLNDAVYGEKKEEILLNAYCYVQPSRYEGQPMGIMEALACGIPCIVTEGTSFAEYINNNECGIGVKFDENELFNAIKKILKNEDFRDKCADNTGIIEKDYNWTKVAKECIVAYKKLLDPISTSKRGPKILCLNSNWEDEK